MPVVRIQGDAGDSALVRHTCETEVETEFAHALHVEDPHYQRVTDHSALFCPDESNQNENHIELDPNHEAKLRTEGRLVSLTLGFSIAQQQPTKTLIGMKVEHHPMRSLPILQAQDVKVYPSLSVTITEKALPDFGRKKM